MPAPDARPPVLAPMKAVLGELPTDDGGWAYEIKWDGIRAVATIAAGRLRLASSNGNDITARYPELQPLAGELAGHACVLDGEVVAFDATGRPDFGLLAGRMHLSDARRIAEAAATVPAVYVVFDLLWLDGVDATDLPYEARRRLLEDLVEAGPNWQVPEGRIGDGAVRLQAAADAGLEGLVAKRLGSRYTPGQRNAAWRKLKVRRRQEFVVGGWRGGEGSRRGTLGALLVGTYEGPHLRYAGRVGSGFSHAELTRLQGLLEATEIADPPFDPPPRRDEAAGARWCEPTLVAELAFAEWSHDRRLRHPSYLGLRDDKAPRDVHAED